MLTFPFWPVPVLGHITFRAPCPCGRDAVWEQSGVGAGDVFTISCGCRESARVDEATAA